MLLLPDGHLKITANLAEALKAFRARDRPQRLWADAVCINQKENEEKSSQVAQMNKTYEYASRVLIWLGGGDESTFRSLQGYYELTEKLALWWRSSRSKPYDNSDYFVRLDGPDEVTVAESLEEDYEAILDGTRILTEIQHSLMLHGTWLTDQIMSHNLNLVYERPWFSRLWTVQEVALAKQPVLCYGRGRLPWSSFAYAISLLKAAHSGSNYAMRSRDAFLRAASVVEARAIFHLQHTSSYSHRFMDILETLRTQDCTVDHDRVYALLNLQSPDIRFAIEPNYSGSMTHVYIDCALRALEQGNADLLNSAGLWTSEEKQPPVLMISATQYLPTWVPDFRRPSHRRQLPWLRRASRFQKSLNGSLTVKREVHKGRSFSIGLQGLLIDRVASVRGASLPMQTAFKYGEPTVFDRTADLVKECQKICRYEREEDYPAGGDLTTAFWRTLMLNGHCAKFGNNTISPKGVDVLVNAYEKHCLDKDGEIARQPLPDLWLRDSEEFPSPLKDMSMEVQYGGFMYDCIRETMDGVVFIMTDTGYVGLGPPGIDTGDLIAVISGTPYPFALRPVNGTEIFLLVGPCYIHGLMDGVEFTRAPQTITLM